MSFPGKTGTLSLIAAALLCWSSIAPAQHKPKDVECLACHADAVPSADGAHTNAAIDAGKLAASIHGASGLGAWTATRT